MCREAEATRAAALATALTKPTSPRENATSPRPNISSPDLDTTDAIEESPVLVSRPPSPDLPAVSPSSASTLTNTDEVKDKIDDPAQPAPTRKSHPPSKRHILGMRTRNRHKDCPYNHKPRCNPRVSIPSVV